MEPTRFDEFTKVLATRTSRRQVLKTIAATTVGGVLGLAGFGNVLAKGCTPNGKHCNSKTVCCSGFCDPTTHMCVAPTTTTTTTLAPLPFCPAGTTCESPCTGSSNPNCFCGTTMAGAPVCYNLVNGCAGTTCSTNADCTAAYGSASTCISGLCSTPALYCSSDTDCATGSACVNLNGGCGGCDAFTGSNKGICEPICTS